MACKTCHKTGDNPPARGEPSRQRDNTTPASSKGKVVESSHLSPHGHVVPPGHGSAGSVAPPVPTGGLAQAITDYYNRTAAKHFVEGD